ncbi:MAG TPA: 1,4-dihydroxy-2-naphthoyl-CoA hydrolase [Cyanobacteria bacterium UBA8553]|nr:1,4-dihydroxy-2-naphthoyl-CoA hydrolase [Cyanobacteria bacterium UBA8553]HAJ58244.1 1,4-dihydroxy-2-naphthoyl-CoA hydrolase [Cyanobacteria bacterium UBA8543]
MPFTHNRTVCFRDTDAAGVVYFSNVLSICHEAYEASLVASDINLKLFFNNPVVAIPIIHASIDFYSPMFCGDQLLIHLIPQQLNDNKFEITYQIVAATSSEQQLAKAITKHVCIDPITRTKTQLPEEIIHWLLYWSN